VLTIRPLGRHREFSVAVVECRDDHRGWSEAEARADHGMVLVRAGRFRRQSRGVAAEVDRTQGYLTLPGEPERFAHPAGGDVCTYLTFSSDLWRGVAGDGVPRRSQVYVDAALELGHRRLRRGGPDLGHAQAEQLLGLLAASAGQLVDGKAPATDATTRAERVRADRALVDRARLAVLEGDPAADGLIELAESLGASPYRLSRAFSREVGVSLTRYRNRVRVGRALDRLEQGERSLAILAADLGFADQAHLTRTMTAHVGETPAVVRRLLAAAPDNRPRATPDPNRDTHLGRVGHL